MNTIIFTDLDGTFLNHNDYSFLAANEALKVLNDKKIPLIFNTSKTKFEVELLQKNVNIKEPFIVENGAAIFFPKEYKNFDLSFLEPYNDEYYIYSLGIKYEKILEFYNLVKEKFNIKGFSDMSLDEVSLYTGLSKEKAMLSKQRGFTEPFIIKNNSLINELESKAFKYGIKITKGGRFYHLIGINQDKGMAVKKACEIFNKLYGEEIFSIGLGDGQNDIAMFDNVNLPIIIKNHKDEYLKYENKNLQKSTFQGSKGWNEMVLKNV